MENSKIRHRGVKPLYALEVLDFKRKIYIENFPDGGYRIWNKRQLKDACQTTTSVIEEVQGCWKCKFCDEYFAKEQFDVLET